MLNKTPHFCSGTKANPKSLQQSRRSYLTRMRMKSINVLLSIFLLPFFFSCHKEEPIQLNETGQPLNDISVVNGHLCFSTADALEQYINGSNSGVLRTKSLGNSIPGFTSISERKAALVNTRAGEMEEMTEEEFNLMRCENLLADPALYDIFDMDLVIEVENKVYKITEIGTFSIDRGLESNLQEVVNNFEPSSYGSLLNGESIEIGGSAVFTNTFGEGSSDEYLVEISDYNAGHDYDVDSANTDVLSTNSLLSSSSFQNYFHAGYGATTYTWSNNSIWKKFCDLIRGKDVSKSVEFDKTHRVKVSVVDVNYLFYATSAIKCVMQKQKKFLGIKYWVSTDADNMAIGFNKLYGELKMNNPRSYSMIAPTTSKYWSKFSGEIDNISSSFIFGNTGLDILKEWANSLSVFIPEFTFMGKSYSNTEIGNKLYEVSKDKIYDWLKSQAGRYSLDLLSGVKKQIQPKDPRVAYFVWGNTTLTYNKEKPFIMGVKEYGKTSSEVVRFDQSFGFSLNFLNGKAGLKGFLPTEFNIKDLDAFGVAKYNGTWKGIRFTL